MKRIQLHDDNADDLQPLMDFPEVLALMNTLHPGEPITMGELRYLDRVAVARFVNRLMSGIFGEDWDALHFESTLEFLQRKREQNHQYAINARKYKMEWARRKRKAVKR